MKSSRVFIFSGLLAAIYVVMTHFIPAGGILITPTIRISFNFIPLSFASMFFGPLIGGITGAVGDVIGALLFPQGGFFLGFTLSAFVTGIIFGLFLYKKPKTILRIILAVLCISIIVDGALNTYWLSILYGKGFMVLLPGRLIKIVAMFPVQIALIYGLWRSAGVRIEKGIIRERS